MELLNAMLGTLANFAAIILGGAVGLLLNKKLPEQICDTLTKGIYFCVVAIGIMGIFDGENPLITVLSVAIGAVLGELIDIDRRINRFAAFLQRKLAAGGKSLNDESESIVIGDTVINPETKLSQSFVLCTLITCVGAMAITGAFESALGNHTVLYSKSIIDAVTVCVLSAALGVGCMMSAFPVLVYQGGLTLIFYYVGMLLPERTVGEVGAIGSILIMIIGFNMLGVTKVKVANLVPAMFVPLILCLFM